MSDCIDVERLRRLECSSWLSCEARHLYATTLTPGFPWYTVACQASKTEHDFAARRYVIPYDYTFKVFVKGRWTGRRLLDVYASELPHHQVAYYEACLRSGRLRCLSRGDRQCGASTHNIRRREVKRRLGADVMPDEEHHNRAAPAHPIVLEEANVVLQQGDVVLHTTHRHEVPVATGVTGVDPVELTAVRIDAYGLLVVNKPTGIPTHATGRYHFNSLLAMLEYVLAPRRLRAWLVDEDPLLQSLVCTRQLTEKERQELLRYYHSSNTDGEHTEVDLERAPRPCYRLDKATSGVLLLGVSGDSTRRVAEALQRKSTAMEARVQQVLLLAATSAASSASPEQPRMPPPQHDERGCIAEGSGSPPASGDTSADVDELVRDLLHANFGLRKRYLTRVRDVFPSSSPHLASSAELVDAFRVHHGALHELNKNVSLVQLRVPPAPDDSSASESGVFPNALLLATPVPSPNSGSAQVAATLCQRLAVLPSPLASTAGDVESLVLCTPFTGRLRQIRVHLSTWGFPLVGDTDHSTRPSSAPAEPTRSGRALYFQLANLPPYVREHVLVPRQPATQTEDDHPLCYECAGWLPTASIGDIAGSASRIYLHAWEYELAEELLSVSRSAEREDAIDPKETSLESPDGCVRRQGQSVIFRATPPSWATAQYCGHR